MLLRMRDGKGADYKILAVPVGEPRYNSVQRMEDLSSHIPREIRHFFQVYKTLEEKPVEVLGWSRLEAAHAGIRRSMVVYGTEHVPAAPFERVAEL